MQNFWHQLIQQSLSDIPSLTKIAIALIKIIILFFLSRIAIAVLEHISHRFFKSKAVRSDERRKTTLQTLVDNVIHYTVYFLYFLMVLQSFGFHIETLLAGAGIAGLAIGLGAQSLIKDVLTGFFILFEDQYGVGDTVQINQFTGTVVSIGLRLTRVRAWTGEVEIIPNGQITTVTNYSRTNSIAVVDVGIAYEADIEEAKKIILEEMNKICEENQEIVVGPVKMLGVQSLGASSVNLRVTVECKPTQQYAIQRLAQQRIKEALTDANIDIPYNQLAVRLIQ
ncbi:mechanosensitive ion channel family protein [Alicyclobacillus tolerans]|uniref:mechanosensitive ion channel family protein n=1 Tax=Alicyclobacillus tolerans TaxID=90970 RepID=UPI003B792937